MSLGTGWLWEGAGQPRACGSESLNRQPGHSGLRVWRDCEAGGESCYPGVRGSGVEGRAPWRPSGALWRQPLGTRHGTAPRGCPCHPPVCLRGRFPVTASVMGPEVRASWSELQGDTDNLRSTNSQTCWDRLVLTPNSSAEPPAVSELVAMAECAAHPPRPWGDGWVTRNHGHSAAFTTHPSGSPGVLGPAHPNSGQPPSPGARPSLSVAFPTCVRNFAPISFPFLIVCQPDNDRHLVTGLVWWYLC